MDCLKLKGTYYFRNIKTNEIKKFDNVICQGFYNNLFSTISDEGGDIKAKFLATGDGTASAKRSDIQLENELDRVSITRFVKKTSQIEIKTTLSTTDSNFHIKEVGIFTDSGLLSRCNVSIDKNESIVYEVIYIIQVI